MAQEVAMKQLKAKAAVIAAVQFLSKQKVSPSDAMKAPLLQKTAEQQEASSKLAAGKAANVWKSKVNDYVFAHFCSGSGEACLAIIQKCRC
jgi:hypothetical protein